jgi:hypothetical protein
MYSKKWESKKDKKINEKRLLSLSIGLGLLALLFILAASASLAAAPLDNNDPPGPPQFHYIAGNATYGGTTPADGAYVTVLNERTMETLSDYVGATGASGKSGEYLVDLFDLPSPFEDGDTISVSIEGIGSYSGWTGTHQITVDTSRVSQIVDVILTSAVNNPPDSPSVVAPVTGSTNVNLNPQLQVMVSDPDNDLLTVTFYDASDDSVIGTRGNIQSGSIAAVPWTGLASSSTYMWYVVVSDFQMQTGSSVWSFTTQAMANRAPGMPVLISPGDMSTGASRSPSLRVMVSDPDNDQLRVTFYDASDDSVIGTQESIESGGQAQVTWTGRSYDTTYEWYVIASDSQIQTQSNIWEFTTEPKPVTPTDKKPSSPQNLGATPGDSATSIYATLTWTAPLDSGSTTLTNYKIYRGTNPGQLTLIETLGNVLTYTDTNLEANIAYFYQVSAQNSIGEGPRSSLMSVTTSDTTPPTITSALASPMSFTSDDTITFSALVTDVSDIQEVVAVISVDGEEIERVTLLSQGDNNYEGTWTAGDQDSYDVGVTARDIYNNQRKAEIGELTQKDDGIPGFELVALLVSFLVMLGVLTLTRQWKKR